MLKLPFRIIRAPESYCIEDAAGVRFGYVYFENEPGRRNATRRLTEAEALEIVKRQARAENERLNGL